MNSQSLGSFAVPGSGYGYTGAKIDTLTSFQNTLAVTVFDESGSTTGFATQMEAAVKEVIKALRRSPVADNLMYRQVHFGTNYREHHGYLPLAQCDPDSYDGCYKPGGTTHLYDACDRVIRETLDYADRQAQMKYLCNGVIYIITDGCDYGSTLKVPDVKLALAKAISSESLESLMTFLIGINPDASVQQGLLDFKAEAGFTEYIPVENADEKSLAKLANWLVSQSVSQSQALGTGGPSQSLTF